MDKESLPVYGILCNWQIQYPVIERLTTIKDCILKPFLPIIVNLFFKGNWFETVTYSFSAGYAAVTVERMRAVLTVFI